MDSDSVNSNGQEKVLQSENDLEEGIRGSAIRNAMIQKRETLRQLIEKEKGIEEDLVRLGTALAPYNRNVFPNEILHHIFILVAQDHGHVRFPISRTSPPPQLAISHVCSRWRRVALQTTELWNNTNLNYPEKDPSHTVRIHQLWLLRSRNSPVTLSITWMSSNTYHIVSTLQTIIIPFQVKKLSLMLFPNEFLDLSLFPETALSTLAEVELDITFFDGAGGDMSDPPHFVSQLRSLSLECGDTKEWLDQLWPSIPWTRLRRLELQVFVDKFHPIFDILRQMLALRKLSLLIYDPQISEFDILQDNKLIMHSLRDLDLELDMDIHQSDKLNKILYSFVCPSLTDFKLYTTACWTGDTIDILRQQYNIRQLENVDFAGFGLPVSSMLWEAPMLRSLSLGEDAIMDDDACEGISNGTLGRFLKRLRVYAGASIEDVFSMVEARKKLVDEMFGNGYSWREEINILRDVTVFRAKSRKVEYEKRIVALGEAGISIAFTS